MDNLFKAIMDKTTGSLLSADVNGRIYLDEAPEGVEFPYIVFFVVSDVPDNVFVDYIDDVMIQFSIFSTSKSATEISTIYSHLKALFDDCELSISGDTLIYMRRDNMTTMVDDDVATPDGTPTVKHWAVDYEIKVKR